MIEIVAINTYPMYRRIKAELIQTYKTDVQTYNLCADRCGILYLQLKDACDLYYKLDLTIKDDYDLEVFQLIEEWEL